jgi:hypothetical protein
MVPSLAEIAQSCNDFYDLATRTDPPETASVGRSSSDMCLELGSELDRDARLPNHPGERVNIGRRDESTDARTGGRIKAVWKRRMPASNTVIQAEGRHKRASRTRHARSASVAQPCLGRVGGMDQQDWIILTQPRRREPRVEVASLPSWYEHQRGGRFRLGQATDELGWGKMKLRPVRLSEQPTEMAGRSGDAARYGAQSFESVGAHQGIENSIVIDSRVIDVKLPGKHVVTEPQAELTDDPPQRPPSPFGGHHRRDVLPGNEWLVQLDTRGHIGSFEGVGTGHDVGGQVSGRSVADVRDSEDLKTAERGGDSAGVGKRDDGIPS